MYTFITKDGGKYLTYEEVVEAKKKFLVGLKPCNPVGRIGIWSNRFKK